IAIFGVGAMGSVYAGLMAEAGHEVWAVDIWQDHVDAINKNGLRVEGASGDRVVQGIKATSEAADSGDCELYVLATKASGVGPAAQEIAPLMGSDSMVITIQNGLGAGERIAEHMAMDRVLLGVADGFGASMKGPGHVHHNAMNLIRVGEMNGGMSARLQDITRVWQQAGFNAQAFEDIDQLIWGKYICNVAFSGPCTVFDYTLGELMADPAAWAIARGCALEVQALAQAKNIAFAFDDPLEYIEAFGHKMPDARPSMLLDHHARRPSEIDAINGMAVELGRQLSIPTPYNEVLTAVVRQREKKF
ncbi:MAG: 2-dehydropantoate 2-reductase, partial [Gammaproteobacteria bacterium]|nr:2-dehydropantoate 2-reductase [Gammaproteobacteria bacterium]